MKDLRNISVIGLGLSGGSIAPASGPHVRRATVIGSSHRASSRAKASDLGIANQVPDELPGCVAGTDILLANSENVAEKRAALVKHKSGGRNCSRETMAF